MSLRNKQRSTLEQGVAEGKQSFENFINNNKKAKALAEYEKTVAVVYNSRPPKFVCPFLKNRSKTSASKKSNKRKKGKRMEHIVEDFDNNSIIIVDDSGDDVVFVEEHVQVKRVKRGGDDSDDEVVFVEEHVQVKRGGE